MNREYTEVLVEQNINGTLDTAYVYGAAIGIGSDRLSLDRFDSSTGYYLYDPKGSVTGIINEEGQIYQSYRYSVFGEITFGASEYENEYTYNGESYNPNIKSQYLRARYYCVVTADFLTEDSYLGNIREPLTLNRYNYCVGNPVNYADPSGQFITAVGGAIIGAIGGFIISGVDFAISAYNTKKSGGEIDWYDGITGILNATATGAVGGGVLGATGNPLLAAAAGGATYGFLNSTAEVAKSGELNTESALHVADETLKGSFISTMSTATFMGEMAFMEPVAMPAVAKLFVAGNGAGVTSTFVDATIEGRKVTDKEILMSGLKGGFDTLIVSEVASAYEYRSYAKWQKTAPSVKAVTERANNTIKSETCEGGTETKTLFHYTNEKGMLGIVESKKLNPSLKANNPKDARYGAGQYLSDIKPDTQTPVSLAKKFINVPNKYKYTHYVEIDVTDLDVIQSREGVFVIPNSSPLDLSDRIVNTGRVGIQ